MLFYHVYAALRLALPEGTTPQGALEAVLRLPSVGSKRFLTTKVDRHVTGEHLIIIVDISSNDMTEQ
jgi:phosphoribosylformylglycinamidine (FGAM) synthase-like enzyme